MAESEDTTEQAADAEAVAAEAPEAAEGAATEGERRPAGPPPQPPRSPEERAAERASRRRERARTRRVWREKQRQRRRQQAATETVPPPVAKPHGSGRPRVRQGVVVSDKADKTLTVRIDVTRQHRVYKKTIRESSTLHAHDERNEARAGDTVRVVESRPISRTKRWRLLEVTERAR